jgi:hypothetical protein
MISSMHWWQGALSLFDTKRQGGRASGEGPGVVEVEEDLTELAQCLDSDAFASKAERVTFQLATTRPEITRTCSVFGSQREAQHFPSFLKHP